MAIAERVLQLHRLDDLRPDEALVRAAQDGEKEAASALVERYYPRVRSFVSYLTNGRPNAEDLTQEVFARALGALGRFNGNYRFEPWLLRIAKNLVIDEARRRVHQPEVTDPSELPEIEPVPVSVDNVWDSVSQQLSTSTVHSALQRLPLRQRTVLVLREIEEMTYADIAQVVGTNVRGVEATLRRARARFRIEVASLESDEAQAAVCRRTLRLIAGEGVGAVGGVRMPEEASRHLSLCLECRGKVTGARGADRLFAAFPPVALTAPAWHAKVLAGLPQRAFRTVPKSLWELVRSGVAHVAAAPVAQVVEVAATVAVAAVVTTAPAKLPASSVQVEPAPVASARPVLATPETPSGTTAGAPSGTTAGANPESTPEVPPAHSAGTRTAEVAGVSDAVPAEGVPVEAQAQTPEAAAVPAAAAPSGLVDGAVLPAAGQLLSDPLGTLSGIVGSLPSAAAGTVDAVAGTVGSTLQAPLGVVQDPLGTVGSAVDGVTAALSDAPIVGDLVSKLPLGQLTGGLLSPPRVSRQPSP